MSTCKNPLCNSLCNCALLTMPFRSIHCPRLHPSSNSGSWFTKPGVLLPLYNTLSHTTYRGLTRPSPTDHHRLRMSSTTIPFHQAVSLSSPGSSPSSDKDSRAVRLQASSPSLGLYIAPEELEVVSMVPWKTNDADLLDLNRATALLDSSVSRRIRLTKTTRLNSLNQFLTRASG